MKAAMLAALLTVPALASAQSATPMAVDIVGPTQHVQCPADQMEFAITPPVAFTWRCTTTGARYKCTQNSAAIIHFGVYAVFANCSTLVLLPPVDIFKHGFE